MPATPSALTCRDCLQPATHMHQRAATPDEGAAYLAAMDEWRVSQGLGPLPDTAAIRSADHTVAVHTCCAHRDPNQSAACPACPDET